MSLSPTLYQDLMALCNEPDSCFYFKDFAKDSVVYRIFNYRLSSYTEFLKPSALECRGVMFDVTQEFDARLIALPMKKFFNLNENPMTMNLNLSLDNIRAVHYKADGSLMSTYIHWAGYSNFILCMKSKGSLFSTQAIDAQNFLAQPENQEFQAELYDLTRTGFTVNLEWVSPVNRVVIGYMEPKLIVLSVRDMQTGLEYVAESDVFIDFPLVRKHWIEEIDKEQIGHGELFIDSIADKQGIEGFVVTLNSDIRFKAKTSWYMTLHHTKDSINSSRRLFECVINETTDDLRAMFFDDPLAIQLITEMENKVVPKFAQIISAVEQYYEENKHLTRKEYAIKGQTIDDRLFGLKMNKYIQRPNDYKEFAIKHPEMFGVKQDDERSTGSTEEE